MPITVLDSLNDCLHRAFQDDPTVLLIGEDVLDPYGGAFKVTRGLSTAYAERVLTAPISEAGMVGVAAGFAMRGFRPVVEIMFGDFLTLAADQVINHLSKFRWMYNNQVSLPLVIRTPMGGRRGYGPTHSQTLEKLFIGVPGLRVLAPTALGNPGELLYDAILNSEEPVLFVENKLLYTTALHGDDLTQDFISGSTTPSEVVNQGTRTGSLPYPTYALALRGAPPSNLTMTAYGYMAELALQAARRLGFEHEVFVDVVIPCELSTFNQEVFITSLARTSRLLTVEEGTYTLGWGAEVVARASEILGGRLRAARRIAGRDLPVPASSSLEAAHLPGVDTIVQAALEMVR
jgi:pyruvate/2-oxoglutarate/acetoin dehydrogenase E1 component